MADKFTKEQRSACMAKVCSADTTPEIKARHYLWEHGFRYRTNVHNLPGSPDIVLPKYRTVIFVHGCFWHGHDGCRNYRIPKTNTNYWTAKVARNKERDQETWRQLEAKGWFVIILWECELEKAKFQDTLARVKAEIISNGDALRATLKERCRAREEYRKERLMQKEREEVWKSELQERFHKRQ